MICQDIFGEIRREEAEEWLGPYFAGEVCQCGLSPGLLLATFSLVRLFVVSIVLSSVDSNEQFVDIISVCTVFT